MYCQHCGSKLPNHSKFCPNCGANVETKSANEEQEEKPACVYDPHRITLTDWALYIGISLAFYIIVGWIAKMIYFYFSPVSDHVTMEELYRKEMRVQFFIVVFYCCFAARDRHRWIIPIFIGLAIVNWAPMSIGTSILIFLLFWGSMVYASVLNKLK